MEQTTENIKLESDTNIIKKEYKHSLDKLNDTKKSISEALEIKERAVKEIQEKQEDLYRVLDEISKEKLEWATRRHQELTELEQKQAEAENVLKRKAELNEQEETIRKIEQSNTDKLNENLRLELKLKDDLTLIKVEARKVEIEKENLTKTTEKAQKDKENFIKEVAKVFKSVENL